MEKIDFLIDFLIKENKSIDIKEIPQNINDKKRLYRSLCNIREPLPISKEYIEIENEFLTNQSKENGIVDKKHIETFNTYKKTQICLWQGDITTLKIDAIVNAANSQGLGCFIPCHKCIDNAIHSASGVGLRLECNEIMQDITEKEILELKECYINSLKIAKKNGIKNIAFPCISTGEFRFPKELASKIAIETVKEYLDTNEENFEKIIFNVFSEEDYKIYLKNLGEIYGRI